MLQESRSDPQRKCCEPASFEVGSAPVKGKKRLRAMAKQAGTESQIRALIEEWAAAVRRHDIPAIMSFHALGGRSRRHAPRV
jgi:hypothetical protein